MGDSWETFEGRSGPSGSLLCLFDPKFRQLSIVSIRLHYQISIYIYIYIYVCVCVCERWIIEHWKMIFHDIIICSLTLICLLLAFAFATHFLRTPFVAYLHYIPIISPLWPCYWECLATFLTLLTWVRNRNEFQRKIIIIKEKDVRSHNSLPSRFQHSREHSFHFLDIVLFKFSFLAPHQGF